MWREFLRFNVTRAAWTRSLCNTSHTTEAQTLNVLVATRSILLIDDFGVGYAFLSCIKRFSANECQVDESM